MKKREFVPLLEEVHGTEDPSYAQVENEIDVSKIYLRVKKYLSWEERTIFCYSLLGYTLKEISGKIDIELTIISQLKNSLIRKLNYAATATQDDIDLFGNGSEVNVYNCCQTKEKRRSSRNLH